mgnify:CR=1 FL=1
MSAIDSEPRALLRVVLDLFKGMASAEIFSARLKTFREEYGDAPQDVAKAYTLLLSTFFAGGLGLVAALSPSLEEVPSMVTEALEEIARIDFGMHKRSLKRTQRSYYESFARTLVSEINSMGETIVAALKCYLSGSYDPDANPNELILEAQEVASTDPERATGLIAQAGASALHGRPLWWRWPLEAYGPLAPKVVAVAELIQGYNYANENESVEAVDVPLNLLLWFQRMKIPGTIGEEIPHFIEDQVAKSAPIIELVRALIDQGEAPYTREQLEFCRAHRDDVIPALIELAANHYLQLENAPGGGYGPIKAVQILGMLKATEAITALIDIVADSDPDEIIYSTAIHALKEIGHAALEPILDFMRYSWNVEAKVALAEVISEIEGENQEAYQILLSVWEKALWEDGKSLLAWPLMRTGGAQAIPLLQKALEDPELDGLDYGEIAEALREAGVEVPAFPEIQLARSAADWENAGYDMLSQLSAPSYIAAVLSTAPEDLRSKPDNLAYLYALTQRSMWSAIIITAIASAPAGAHVQLTESFLKTLADLTFPPPPRDLPAWQRKVYSLLPREFEHHIKPYLEGILLPLRHYLKDDYDIAEEPDQLLARARELPPEDENLSVLFGKAGALTLRGRQFWPLWSQESDPPLSIWMEGLQGLNTALRKVGQIPFHPPVEGEQNELVANVMSALVVKSVIGTAPPPVDELLQELVACKQKTLPPARRRAFARHQAALIPYLIELVDNTFYWYQDSPGEGWAPILAVELLGEFKAVQAAPVLVKAVAASTPEDIIHDAALFSLMAIGNPAFPAVRAYMRYGRNIGTKTSLAEVIGRIGRRERESFDLLRQVWEEAEWSQNRRVVALAFGDLKDRRAVPLLQAALSDKKADAIDLDYIRWALAQFGIGTPPQQRRSSRMNVPPPYNPRLIHDMETETVQRLRYTPWGEPLCPDCGSPLIPGKDGELIHPPQQVASRSGAGGSKRKKRRKR